MIAIFDEDGGGNVDFQEFVSGLSAFSSKGNKEQKLRFAFKVYDIDRDGYISNGELFIVLKMMVGSNLKDQQLQQIVDKTIMEADLDKDGKISFEEFSKMVENTDVSMSMTLGECPCSCSPMLRTWLTVLDAQTNSKRRDMQWYNNCKDGYNDPKLWEKLVLSHLSELTFGGIAGKVAGKSPDCSWEVLHLSIVRTRQGDQAPEWFPKSGWRTGRGCTNATAISSQRLHYPVGLIWPLPITRPEPHRVRSPVLPTCAVSHANWIAPPSPEAVPQRRNSRR